MAAIDRQAVFRGTEAPPERLALDVATLGAFPDDEVEWLGRDFSFEKSRSGQSNPTDKLTGEAAVVLRRWPPGKLLASAHAIDREYRVMEAVGRDGIPAPRLILTAQTRASRRSGRRSAPSSTGR